MKERLFFSGLNELRAFASLAVVWHHIELYKYRLNITSLYELRFIRAIIARLGSNGVFLFFVLSGFLITYLLLDERKKNGEISITRFYSRRILRIWPLYFLILLIAFFTLPFIYYSFPDFFAGQYDYNERIENLKYGSNLILFLLLFSNFSLSFFGPVAGASHSWSVSVEEQFYLVWPWLVKFFSRVLVPVLLLIIVSVNAVQWIYNEYDIFDSFIIMRPIVKTFHIDFMAMGGLFAWAYVFKKEKLVGWLKSKIAFGVVVVLVLAHLYYRFSAFTLSICYALLIVSFIEHGIHIKLFDFLGKISYGIYMYHPLMMYFAFSLASQLGLTSVTSLNLFVYPVILGLTFLVSFLSYRYMESYFLRWKDKFSVIKSGNL